MGCTPKVDDEGRYAICTNYTTLEVENFAKSVKADILRGNLNILADKVAFPVMVNGKPTEKNDFFTAIREILVTQDFIEGIKQETCYSMFCNSQGIMMSDGRVWISEILEKDGISQGLRIIAFNTMI